MKKDFICGGLFVSIVIYIALCITIMYSQKLEINEQYDRLDRQQKEIDSLVFKYNCLEAQIYPELHND